MMNKNTFPKGLIVSCQALEGNPLRNSERLAVMAKCAMLGGASAIRANGVHDIAAMRGEVTIPIIGIDKQKDDTGRTVITPTFEGAKAIHDAGADIIALDGTFYPSTLREDLATMIRRIHDELHCLVMADISTFEEAVGAAKCGADAVSTTLAGYIPGAMHTEEGLYTPDFALLHRILDAKLGVAVVAEGRFWNGADVTAAFEMGVDAMVIGKAVTNPVAITKYYVKCVEKAKNVQAVPTETVNEDTRHIAEGTTAEMLYMINNADATVAAAVRHCIPQIARLADAAVGCIENGGRMIYCGCGTSGRLGIIDAAECPPTYGLSPETITAVIAGGYGAIVNAAEGCEDSAMRADAAFEEKNVTAKDLVIGISAAGKPAFVMQFMKRAKELGCKVGAIVNNADTPMEALADYPVTVFTGAEVIRGSTRMKAGTAQKMILAMLSTTVCIKLGHVMGNYMVNMTVSNEKLQKRAVGMISDLCEVDADTALTLLNENGKNVKAAVRAYFEGKKA